MTNEEWAKCIIIHLTGRPEDPTPMLLKMIADIRVEVCDDIDPTKERITSDGWIPLDSILPPFGFLIDVKGNNRFFAQRVKREDIAQDAKHITHWRHYSPPIKL